MSAELPLKIRVDIRDKWDSPKGLIQQSIDNLTKTLGHKIVPYVQWTQFYNAVKDAYPDKALFVPAISRVANAFYGRLLARLDDDANSEWTEKLLETLTKKSNADWLLQIEATTGSRPKVALKINLGAFTLEIPNRELPLNASIDAGFDQDLDRLFSSEPRESQMNAGANDDEWAEVIPGYQTRTSQSEIAHPSILAAPRIQKLPEVDALDRPAELFKATTPYILTVDARTSPLVVQGSHQPSLELLASYLGKWAKTNMNDSLKRPILKVNLVESAFVFGVIDAIHIEPTHVMREPLSLNPTIVLAFVEGILGYKETHTTGNQWVFKFGNALK